MILLDKPYISDLLMNTIIKNKYPIVPTNKDLRLPESLTEFVVSTDEAVKIYDKSKLLYTNSENTISWINTHLAHTTLPGQVTTFKNNAQFRDMLNPIFPNFKYEAVSIVKLEKFDPKNFGFPLIIKPAIGFFSMGIYVVHDMTDWQNALKNLHQELQNVKGVYPDEVMNSTQFLIEQQIQGSEYAVDVYFDSQSKPQIINIYEHIFTNSKDVSDRAYFTSDRVILKTKSIFEKVLDKIGNQTQVKNFPMHIEFRITPENEAIPIEANPLRFAGWCMTDMGK